MDQAGPVSDHLQLLVRARGSEGQQVALRRGHLGRRVVRAVRVARPARRVGRVAARDVHLAGRDVVAEDGALEDEPGGFRLVGGRLVAGVEDAREGEVAVLPDEPAGVAVVDFYFCIPRAGERVLVVVGYVQRCVLAADPLRNVSTEEENQWHCLTLHIQSRSPYIKATLTPPSRRVPMSLR